MHVRASLVEELGAVLVSGGERALGSVSRSLLHGLEEVGGDGGKGHLGVEISVNDGLGSVVTIGSVEDVVETLHAVVLSGLSSALDLLVSVDHGAGNTTIVVEEGDPLDAGGVVEGISDLLLVLAGGDDGGGLLVHQGGVDNDNLLGVLGGNANHSEGGNAEDHSNAQSKEDHPLTRPDLTLELSNLGAELGLDDEGLGESSVGVHLLFQLFPFGVPFGSL
mmetsp:Transcript_28911/g.35137  ORF Transcript_28911/g.35137 Transcript_28911/m.35137 type:complete len:221 (-) Transcript_28911:80-742(-)